MLACMRGLQEGNYGLWGCDGKQRMIDGMGLNLQAECIFSDEVKGNFVQAKSKLQWRTYSGRT